MSEKFLSNEEKWSANDIKLVREGADLIYDKENEKPRIRVTNEQIEQARGEMEDYLANVKKEKELKMKSEIEVEKTFIALVQATHDKDIKKMNKNIVDLIAMIGENVDISLFTSSIVRGGAFDINSMLRNMSEWVEGNATPVIGKTEDGKLKLLNIIDIVADRNNALAPDVHKVLNKMADRGECIKLKFKNGTERCTCQVK